ncbi:MAG: hypothetical protein CME88_09315 [Hirschia sp.]|nr:hypothetical protein [Hirschia sp.]MBF18563.1 hypothetical protein [Hirschia sp.]|tara:strand:- start:382 stop:675 length:294 start_codon:yes stop_codon:yes gene_type:complete
MPYFVIHAMDRRPDGPAIRAETRPAHLEYLRRVGDKVKLAGMMLQEDGETSAGSMIVVEVDDIHEARAIAENDPYAKAGLFASCDVRAYRWAINPPK